MSELEQMFFGVKSVNTIGKCTTSYLLAGLACVCVCEALFLVAWTK